MWHVSLIFFDLWVRYSSTFDIIFWSVWGSRRPVFGPRLGLASGQDSSNEEKDENLCRVVPITSVSPLHDNVYKPFY